MAETDSNRAERIITQAKELLQQCVDDEADIRRKCKEDLIFLAASPDDPAGQWGETAVRDRSLTGRPSLVVNRLDQFVQHVSNSMRQNRMSAKVFPVDDKGDIETAEVRQGLIRHIETNSKGTLAYDTAAFYAVAMGFGFWRINTEYTDPLSFDLDIKLERIQNPFQVYLGPHTLPDGSDAEYGFIFTELTKEEFKSEHPDAQPIGFDDFSTDQSGWVGVDTVRVVEFWVTEWQGETLVNLGGGKTALLSELPQGIDRDTIPEKDKRETRIPKVRWYKLNAREILDETDWPIPRIPIVKVTGHELNVNGKLILKGMVRNLKDAQRQYNYMLSAETEAIDASRGQLLMAEGQEEGHEDEFADLSRQKVLRYKPTDLQGQPVPPPGRLQPNMSIPAMTQARAMAADDLKALTGVYDAALGARSNETSGRGILARQAQSETANFHFQDNLLLSVSYSTRMLVDLMPYVYDGARVLRIVGEDDSQKVVKVNQDFDANWTKQTGQKRRFNFSVGKYDVVCTAGPSFQTKRQEASSQLVDLAKVDPGLMATAADIVYKAIDVPYAQEIAERRKKMLPPELQDAKEGQPEIPPQVQQQIAVLMQKLEALNAYAKQKEQEADEGARKERVELAKLDFQREELDFRRDELTLKLDSQEAIALLKAEIEGIKASLDIQSQELAQEVGDAAREM